MRKFLLTCDQWGGFVNCRSKPCIANFDLVVVKVVVSEKHPLITTNPAERVLN